MANKNYFIFSGIGAAVAVAAFIIFFSTSMDKTSPALIDSSQEDFSKAEGATQQQNETVPEPSASDDVLMKLFSTGSPVLGSPDAPITMIEFGDYQCLNCNRYFHNTEHLIKEKYVDTGMMKIIFMDFAFIGPDSVSAAQAAHCANDQDRYWEYHDEVYSNWDGENTGWASKDNLKRFASNIGPDTEAFNACLDSAKHAGQVDANFRLGSKLGVTGTPTFFIIGVEEKAVKIVGAQPYSVFEQVLDSGS